MKIKKLNELNDLDEIIKKIDNFSEKDMYVFYLQSFGNAHYFMMNFLNSGDNNRIKNNPHGIKYDRMFKEFGEPNFIRDYDGSYFWILEYKGEKYSVDVNEHEGSMICKFFNDVEFRTYNKQFNQDAQNFYNQLFKQLN